MSIKVDGTQRFNTTEAARNLDWQTRSLVSSNRQKVFQAVLQQAQPGREDAVMQEINSLRQELKGLSSAGGEGQKVDPRAGLSSLETSALLRMSALSSGIPSSRSGYSRTSHSGNVADISGAAGTASRTDKVIPGQDGTRLGSLAAQFESGDSGVGAIGYDDKGGTSYGTFQISSRTGTMQRFLKYLDDEAPDLAGRLRGAGSANTGSRSGRMPREWQRIADEQPERFAKLQESFIHETHYAPALQEILDRTGINVEEHSKSLREVLWSTAVQHGPKGAANIFCKVLTREGGNESKAAVHRIIDSVYASRAGQFGSSTPSVRAAVRRRFEEEKELATAMLTKDSNGTRV